MGTINSASASPFLHCGYVAKADSFAILHLKRDLLIPTLLRSQDELNEGYDEGKVTNTRFGSFPHSTLIGTPWGSQIRASAVDTGSRGRKGWERSGKKRKRGDEDFARGSRDENVEEEDLGMGTTRGPGWTGSLKEATEAATGFVHLLPPTPETWTVSLPHRTQVVYTPDYSYVLHRIRARPGTNLIEAGAGSGSFTHAAARAVYDDPSSTYGKRFGQRESKGFKNRQLGNIYSFEFHEQRAQKLRDEIKDHGLDNFVSLTSRDVCADGFILDGTDLLEMNVSAIFLDLPAPWLALKHLTRNPAANGGSFPSPLDPSTATHLCTFSPCVEQVTRTISTLRSLGWVEIEMVEIAAKRIEVKRERVGLQEEGLRGVNDSPADVTEALSRLKEIEGRIRAFHSEGGNHNGDISTPSVSKQQRLEDLRLAQEGRKVFKEGRLIHKAEPEMKLHTSYLVFAILPREWGDKDEIFAQERWLASKTVVDQTAKMLGKKARKREAKSKAGGNKASEIAQDLESFDLL